MENKHTKEELEKIPTEFPVSLSQIAVLFSIILVIFGITTTVVLFSASASEYSYRPLYPFWISLQPLLWSLFLCLILWLLAYIADSLKIIIQKMH